MNDENRNPKGVLMTASERIRDARVRFNEGHFDFGMTPAEAEMLYRTLNGVLNDMADDDPNFDAMTDFRDRVAGFTRLHPVRYGADARL